MSTRRTRSAALLISVYVDSDDGAPWYAQLRAFDDPAADIRAEQVREPDQLIDAVRRWLDSVIDEP
jgi:hypothetical protein